MQRLNQDDIVDVVRVLQPGLVLRLRRRRGRARFRRPAGAVAQDIKLVHALISRAAKAELNQRPVISSWSQLVNYCRMTMAHAPREPVGAQEALEHGQDGLEQGAAVVGNDPSLPKPLQGRGFSTLICICVYFSRSKKQYWWA